MQIFTAKKANIDGIVSVASDITRFFSSLKGFNVKKVQFPICLNLLVLVRQLSLNFSAIFGSLNTAFHTPELK